jgi:serine/threonine protein phosphatase PrpC
VSALRQAFTAIDTEVLKLDEMQYQGSTAVAVTVHEGENGSRTLVSANVGDSRAILCRKGAAVDLTRDHKPTDERERARIHAMGEHIEWDNYSKVHRIKNLSLSRAVGDRFAKPVVSGEAEIKIFPVRDDDDFIVLASDGLWDVMTSDQVVQFVNKKLDAIAPTGKMGDGVEDIAKRLKDVRRKNMSRYVATEALKRGSADNICVLIVWLKPMAE